MSPLNRIGRRIVTAPSWKRLGAWKTIDSQDGIGMRSMRLRDPQAGTRYPRLEAQRLYRERALALPAGVACSRGEAGLEIARSRLGRIPGLMQRLPCLKI